MKYKYEGFSHSGAKVSGSVEAKSKSEAIIKIKESCSVVTKITESRNDIDLSSLMNKGGKITDKDIALMCNQFGIILKAGLPLIRTVELVANQCQNPSLKLILENVASDITAGSSLADSFARRASSFPTTFTETIRAGEESGSLEKAFERLCDYFTHKGEVKGKVKSALTYPAFVLCVAVVVIVIIMVKAVPVFTETFIDMGIELPGVTKALIAASDFFTKYILVIVAIVALIVILIKYFKSTPNGALTFDKLNLIIPIIGKIQLMNGSSQFANTLSTMLSAGLPAIKALSVTGKSLSNVYLQKCVADAVTGVEQGYQIGESLKKTKVFPELLVEMTSIGEESGSLEQTLQVVGRFYDSEVDTTTTKAVSLLEPIIICFLAIFVVFVLLAVYLPMFSMYGSI